jgi:hypothetical protein
VLSLAGAVGLRGISLGRIESIAFLDKNRKASRDPGCDKLGLHVIAEVFEICQDRSEEGDAPGLPGSLKRKKVQNIPPTDLILRRDSNIVRGRKCFGIRQISRMRFFDPVSQRLPSVTDLHTAPDAFIGPLIAGSIKTIGLDIIDREVKRPGWIVRNHDRLKDGFPILQDLPVH